MWLYIICRCFTAAILEADYEKKDIWRGIMTVEDAKIILFIKNPQTITFSKTQRITKPLSLAYLRGNLTYWRCQTELQFLLLCLRLIKFLSQVTAAPGLPEIPVAGTTQHLKSLASATAVYYQGVFLWQGNPKIGSEWVLVSSFFMGTWAQIGARGRI